MDDRRKLLSIVYEGCANTAYADYVEGVTRSVNSLIARMQVLHVCDEVEVVLCDWGSDKDVFAAHSEWSSEARKEVRFITIPSADTRLMTNIEGFWSTHALNVAVRRAQGQYLLILGPDGDVSVEVLATLLQVIRKGRMDDCRLDDTFFRIPIVSAGAGTCGIADRADVFTADAGFFLGKVLWESCGGLNEELPDIRESFYELHVRLEQRYRFSDAGRFGMTCGKTSNARSLPLPQPVRIPSHGIGKKDWGCPHEEFPVTDGYGQNRPQKSMCVLDELRVRNVSTIVTTDIAYRDVVMRFGAQSDKPFYHADLLTDFIDFFRIKRIAVIGKNEGAVFFAKDPCVEQVISVALWRGHNEYERFLSSCLLEGVAEKVYPLRTESVEAGEWCKAAQMTFDMVFLNIDDSPFCARRDTALWSGLLSNRGVVCGNGWLRQTVNSMRHELEEIARSRGSDLFIYGDVWIMLPVSETDPGALILDAWVRHAPRQKKFKKFPDDITERAVGGGSITLSREKGLFSVIVIAGSSFQATRKCIESVLSQDYPLIEIAVQDIRATQETRDLLKTYGDRVFTCSSGTALYGALSRISGAYWSVCDGDADELQPGALMWAYQQFQHNPAAAVIYGDAHIVDNQGRITHKVSVPDWDCENFICSGFMPLPAATFFRTNCWLACGAADYTECDGFDVLMRIGLRYPLCHVPEAKVCTTAFPAGHFIRDDRVSASIMRRLGALDAVFDDERLPAWVHARREKAYAGVYAAAAYALCHAGRWAEAKESFLAGIQFSNSGNRIRECADMFIAHGTELCEQGKPQAALEYLDLPAYARYVPRGLCARRAQAFIAIGNIDQARKEMTIEKTLYPAPKQERR
jgi:hypothetical protein